MHPNQYIYAGGTAAVYPKQIFLKLWSNKKCW